MSAPDNASGASETVRLATVARGASSELRVEWATYKGQPFLNLRVWHRRKDNGTWLPDPRRGVALKRGELVAVLAGITQAVALLGGRAEDGASSAPPAELIAKEALP